MEAQLPLQLKINSQRLAFAYSHRKTKIHSHNVWQIDIMLWGEAHVYFSGKKMRFISEQCVIISPKTRHSFEYLAKSSFVSIRFAALEGEELLRGAFLGVHLVSKLSDSYILRNALCSILASTNELTDRQKTLAQYCLSGLMCALTGDRSEPPSNSESEIAARIGNYIKANSFSALSVNALAKRFNLSLSRMYRLFHDMYNISMKEYILQQRTVLAKELLSSGDRTVTAIAQYMHFSGIQDFSRFFKRQVGLSPREFRRNQSSPS